MTQSLLNAPDSAIFDCWAEVYDTGSNPLLMLEEQALPPLLPQIAGLHVLDVGCGTGRWLSRLESLQPASLVGTDCSPGMLERARPKLASTSVLIRDDSRTLPVADASQDLILSSFVLSYLDDLPGFASECARALQPGGHVLLSDMHPDTAAQRGWTRSFQSAGEKVHIAARPYRLNQIIAIFRREGFDVCHLAEPSFEIEQQVVFEHAGRLAEFQALTGLPAIYVLKLQKQANLQKCADAGAGVLTTLLLTKAKWAMCPSAWSSSPLWIDDGRIAAHPEHRSITPSASIDLSGYLLLPGLINAHDHLEFALFPNMGRSGGTCPYESSAEWAYEIHRDDAAAIEQHSRVSLETRLWWGAIRNLLCGVTAVCHHNPHHPELRNPEFPVRVVSTFGWGHSLTFEPGLAERFRATPPDRPFVLHAAEGTDKSSSEELGQLDRMHLLDHRTVIVHGLALTTDDVRLLNRRGAALVLCPTSNRYLFSRAPSNSFIYSIQRVALGSDSSLTAAGDLLDEIHFLAEQKLDPHAIYNLITTNAAAVFQLRHGEGRILRGGSADLIAVRSTGTSPAETLAQLTLERLELVMLSGRVQLASPDIYTRLSGHLRIGLHLLEVDGQQRWVRAPLRTLFRSAEQVLGSGNLRLGGRQVRHLPSH